MDIKADVEGGFAKAFLSHLQDGDKGSTLLGGLAGYLMMQGLDFGALLHEIRTHAPGEQCARLAAGTAFFLYGWLVAGRKDRTGQWWRAWPLPQSKKMVVP